MMIRADHEFCLPLASSRCVDHVKLLIPVNENVVPCIRSSYIMLEMVVCALLFSS